MKKITVIDPIIAVADFHNNIPKHKAVIMVYTMKGCGYCENLKPKWETIKEILSKDPEFNDVMIADIDSNASSMLSMPPVSGYPSIKVLKDNNLHEYNGEREVDPLLTFMRNIVTKHNINSFNGRGVAPTVSNGKKSPRHKRNKTASNRRGTIRRKHNKTVSNRRGTMRRKY